MRKDQTYLDREMCAQAAQSATDRLRHMNQADVAFTDALEVSDWMARLEEIRNETPAVLRRFGGVTGTIATAIDQAERSRDHLLGTAKTSAKRVQVDGAPYEPRDLR